MSHIVIHDDNDNITRYRRFDDVSEAVAYLEELHNGEASTSAQLFAMEEVEFAVTSYVKVEIPAATAAAPLAIPESAAAEAVETPPVDDAATVEYVEAAMAPSDVFAPAPAASSPDAVIEPTANGEVRRGLFGR